MTKAIRITLFLIITIAVLYFAGARKVWATDYEDCSHPRFLEKGCGYEGKDGKDGKDGKVPTEWITNVHHWYDEVRDAIAADSAMQVYLPQDQTSRLTMGMSRVRGVTGIGLGYAYIMDNDRNTALTLSLGRAGDETALRGSIGFEFGGARKIDIPDFKSTAEPEEITNGGYITWGVGSPVTLVDEPVDEPVVMPFNVDQLVAELTDEQYEELRREIQMNDEQYQLMEQRQAQQRNLIRAQAEEIERVKREAEALRIVEEARQKEEAATRAKFQQRLAKKEESK